MLYVFRFGVQSFLYFFDNLSKVIFTSTKQLKHASQPTLECLTAIMKHYPRTKEFKKERGHMCKKILIPAMMSFDNQLQNVAVKYVALCFCIY